jgi:DNA-binding PadR family transcriptional regulator
MAKERLDLLQGTLDLLILRTLLFGPAHGHAIAKHIRQTSDQVLQVETGSLYPALHRLEAQGWLAANELEKARAVLPLTAAGKQRRRNSQVGSDVASDRTVPRPAGGENQRHHKTRTAYCSICWSGVNRHPCRWLATSIRSKGSVSPQLLMGGLIEV